ncbi:MAG: tetratricopeptide repeat protein [Planctomycetota bacterium]|nr:tetratricopeptide repeat protein [Planctomycetota bacterium]
MKHPRPPNPRTLAIEKAAQRANPASPPAPMRDPDEMRFAAREAEAAASVALVMLTALEEQKKEESGDADRLAAFTAAEAEPIEKELRRALECDPLQENAYLLLGWLYDRCGQLQKASEALEKCLALNERRADAYNRLGLVRIKQDRREEALACFEKARLLSQGEGQAYRDSLYNLGAAHEALRASYLSSAADHDKSAQTAAEHHRQEAIRYWRAFLESEPTSPAAAKVRQELSRLENRE